MNNHIIKIQNCTVSYPSAKNGQRVTVLNDINLQLQKGELLALVGTSGCGKSTILSAILGSQFPTKGAVFIDNKEVTRVTRDCGLVPQNYSLFTNNTMLENAIAGPILEGTSLQERILFTPIVFLADLFKAQKILKLIRYSRIRDEALANAKEILRRCGLDPEKDGGKYPYELSGGMRQRTAIAQSLMMRPKILLLDEPFSGLDEKTRQEMLDLIYEQWKRYNITVVFVTHHVHDAVALGTRIVCLSQHWLDESGNPGQGAKIVIDKKLSGGAILPSEFVKSEEFTLLTESIRSRTIDKDNPLPIASFELTHPDAFKTKEQNNAQ